MSDLSFVTVARIAELRRKAEEVVRLCDEMVNAPDLVQPVRRVQTVEEAMARVEFRAVEAQGGFQRVAATVVAPSIRKIRPSRKNSYGQIAWRHFSEAEFSLDQFIEFLEPRLTKRPARLRQIVKQALTRDKRFLPLVTGRSGTWYRRADVQQLQRGAVGA